jgi:hypothetical protein
MQKFEVATNKTGIQTIKPIKNQIIIPTIEEIFMYSFTIIIMFFGLAVPIH